MICVWYSLLASVDGRAQFDGGRGILGDLFAGHYGPVPTLEQCTNTDQRFLGAQDQVVVVVPGQHHDDARSYEWLNEDLARHGRVVLILHGDEASLFDWRQIHHPNLTWWVMTPRRSVHGDMPDGTRFVGEGAGPRVALPPTVKDLDTVFMGQATHSRRAELVAAMAPLDQERNVCETTPGFLQGRERAGYLSMLSRAKVAPCPSGAKTVDSFRLYEALEVGCVPVVERLTPDGCDHDAWSLMYPDGLPFPVVDDWQAELPTLLPWLLERHDEIAAACAEWWSWQKAEYARWLTADVCR